MIKLCKPDGSLNHGSQRCAPGLLITVEIPDNIPELCSGSMVHAYESPEQAEIMRYVHGYKGAVVAYECFGEAVISDGTKLGCRSILVGGRTAELPQITDTQRVAIAIVLAWPRAGVEWCAWARLWMSDGDRTADAAADLRPATEEERWAARAAVRSARGLRPTEAAARAVESWAARAASAHISIRDVVRRVLDTPEREWPQLLDALGEDG